MRASLLLASALCLGVAPLLQARDVYGNNTAWTNSDTTIDNIQRERRASEPTPQWWSKLGSPTPAASWKEQQALRLRQQEEMDREAYYREDYSSEKYRRTRESIQEKPLSYEQALLNDVNRRSDRVAQEALGFYLLSLGRPLEALYHLEMIAFLKKSERAGEAAYELHRIACSGGAQPDPARARKYLTAAVELGYPDAVIAQGRAWIAGDEKNGSAQDMAKGEALLTALVKTPAVWNARYAGEILFKEYYLGAHLPADPAKAVAITRLMREITPGDAVTAWQEDRFTELLIAEGWAKNHGEIIESIKRHHGDIVDAEKAERLARIHLGLDPEVAAHVPIDTKKAAAVLFNLARLSPGTARNYLSPLLEPGPTHDADAAYMLLNRLREFAPADGALWIRLTSQLLNNHYGDRIDPEIYARYNDELISAKTTSDDLLAAARFLATGGEGIPADPGRSAFAYQRALERKDVDAYPPQAYTAGFELARLLLLGDESVRDVPAGIAVLEQLIATARPEANPHRALLASVYRTGGLVPRDLEKARGLVREAARDHHPAAAYEYAATLYSINKDTPLDDDEKSLAFGVLNNASRTGLTEIYLLLARFYREGFGVYPDPAEALAIYESGVAANVSEAFTGLASLHLDPESPLHDPAAGFAAAKRATELGDARAYALLGECHRHGWGTPVDPDKAAAAFAAAPAAIN